MKCPTCKDHAKKADWVNCETCKPTPHSPTPTHLPVPWNCTVTPIGVVIAGSEYVVTTVGNSERDKANAAFIVRACNFHQVLLNIAKNLEYKRHGKLDPTCEVCQTIIEAEK